MKKIVLMSAAFICALFVSQAGCFAPYYGPWHPDWVYHGTKAIKKSKHATPSLTKGTFDDSCKGCVYKKSHLGVISLTCDCGQGKTSLNPKECSGIIVNKGGKLVCQQ